MTAPMYVDSPSETASTSISIAFSRKRSIKTRPAAASTAARTASAS
jgi:hypothetical protein